MRMPVDHLLQFDLFGILSNINAYLVFFISLGGAIGAFSRKLSITAFGGLLTYAYVVINTDIFIFNAILYLIVFIICLWGASFVINAYMASDIGGADG